MELEGGIGIVKETPYGAGNRHRWAVILSLSKDLKHSQAQ